MSGMALKAAIVIVLAAATATVALVGRTDERPGTFAHDRTPNATPAAEPAPRPISSWRYAPTRWRRLLAQRPYLGVACRVPNSIRCDRVGLAVWLRRGSAPVRAAVAGRRLRLRPASGRRFQIGYLRRAGLADGPLRLPCPARARWYVRELQWSRRDGDVVGGRGAEVVDT